MILDNISVFDHKPLADALTRLEQLRAKRATLEAQIKSATEAADVARRAADRADGQCLLGEIADQERQSTKATVAKSGEDLAGLRADLATLGDLIDKQQHTVRGAAEGAERAAVESVRAEYKGLVSAVKQAQQALADAIKAEANFRSTLADRLTVPGISSYGVRDRIEALLRS